MSKPCLVYIIFPVFMLAVALACRANTFKAFDSEEMQEVGDMRLSRLKSLSLDNRVLTEEEVLQLPRDLTMKELVDFFGNGLSQEVPIAFVYPRAGFHHGLVEKQYFGYYFWFKKGSLDQDSDKVTIYLISRSSSGLLKPIEGAGEEYFNTHIIIWPSEHAGEFLSEMYQGIENAPTEGAKGSTQGHR